MIYYGFEGHDIFMYRNKPITLSFSVKSNKTGTFVVSFRNSSSNKSYLAEYTINQADVWERKTITITLEDILWAQDNSGGLYIRWIMGSGSNFENAVTNSWIAGDIYSTPNQTQLFEDSGDYFQIAEFMLNEGANSYNIQRSSFDFSAELSKCQRYLTPWDCRWYGVSGGGNYYYLGEYSFPVEMRDIPTITVTSQTNSSRFDLVNAAVHYVDRKHIIYTYDSSTSGGNDGWYALGFADAEL